MINILRFLTVTIVLSGLLSTPVGLYAQEPNATNTAQTTPVETPYIIEVRDDSQLPMLISIGALLMGIIALYTKSSVPVTILRVESAPTLYNAQQATRLAGLLDEGVDLTLAEYRQNAERLVTDNPLKIAEALKANQPVLIPGGVDINAIMDALQKSNSEATQP